MKTHYPQQQEVTSGISVWMTYLRLSQLFHSQPKLWIDKSLCAGNLGVFSAWVWQQCSQPCADKTKSPPFLRIRDFWICNEKLLSLWKKCCRTASHHIFQRPSHPKSLYIHHASSSVRRLWPGTDWKDDLLRLMRCNQGLLCSFVL